MPTHRQILDAVERVNAMLPPVEGPENAKYVLACDIVRAVFEETGIES